MDSGIISMDVEDVKASYYDVMRMAGKLVISKDSQPFQRHLDNVGDGYTRGWMEANLGKYYVRRWPNLVWDHIATLS